ncbi:hypothetical protein J3A83DRAFT_4086610, partial [Scleroderma citrinum]
QHSAMALHFTQTLIVYPSVSLGDKQGVSLQLLLVSIYFSGSFPRHLAKKDIPIQISVSVSEEFSSFMMPIIAEVVKDSWIMQSSQAVCFHTLFHTSYLCISGPLATSQSESSLDDIPIPFLPLPHNFDLNDMKNWMVLCNDIQHWLLSISEQSQQWSWGCEMFWLTFVAANPDFLGGIWPVWNTRIMPEGLFIEGWLDNSLKHTIGEDGEVGGYRQIHQWLWDEFS